MSDNLSLFEMYQGSFRDLERTERISPVTVDKIKLIHEMRDSKLSSFAAHSTSSRGRVVPEQECTIRNCYERDLGRIIYSQAFRRLKHKTQVFFNPANDHICSRLEHVIYVSYIASTIGSALNLNTDLIRAIALGHDVGHTPFGHSGERVLNKKLRECDSSLYFEHESNGLRVLDVLEKHGSGFGLNLSFEVRDGIICHCGETYGERVLVPCKDKSEDDLSYLIPKGRRKLPATLEGCVVRFADKIAYVGRDIEDALRTGVIESEFNLPMGAGSLGGNNSEIINYLVEDIVENSIERNEIKMSDKAGDALENALRNNVDVIYKSPKVVTYEKYCDMMLDALFDSFFEAVKDIDKARNSRNDVIRQFANFVDSHPQRNASEQEMPLPIFVSDYIAGMTDTYATKCFNELFKN
ncbi:MAG: HD domain-containing protein [Mageeibacillus sp.]|nr:HD domain-containing protein [Mageeibacillus sp.]MCI1263978.1 HD domain-containing protein [Saccharofermentans sp.]MCI1768921.1 HD domain-containing protein [Mageeibacillus sp.]MCI2043826.1 HD domain-containing protein [Mageeibacillus sp.]